MDGPEGGDVDSWRKFVRLSWAERRLLVAAFLLLPGIGLALKLMSFRRLHLLLASLSPAVDESREDSLNEAHQVAHWVDVAGRRGIFRPNCLHRSFTLWWLLRQRDLGSELRIGVRLGSGQMEAMEAHAWVEHAGRVLNDTEKVRQDYVPFSGAILPVGAKLR